ncbi:hypothetical protein FRC01_009571 [Tulasnella sp. 417]|nr:hypothetical protein FRC01_009571 [Tulasnella sp. 417]
MSPSSTATSKPSTSRRGREDAATSGRPPRRNAALRAEQLVHDQIAPTRRRRRTPMAATNRGPTISTLTRTRSTPPHVQDAASTSPNQPQNNLNESAKETKTGLSVKAKGKKRRIEPAEGDEEPLDPEEGSPRKKARQHRNLRNRSTPARLDVPKEEPTSPNPRLATPGSERASAEDEESKAGPSTRGRFDVDGEPLATSRAPSPGPAPTFPVTEQPSHTWSVQAQLSLSTVHTPQEPAVPPTPLIPPAPLPDFVLVIPAAPPAPTQPAAPPVPAQPGPLRRNHAKIIVRAGPSRQ